MTTERNCSTCDHWIPDNGQCKFMGWIVHEWDGHQVRRYHETDGNESCKHHTPAVKHPKQKRTRKKN
ncbi:MAG TPA: hypothetical protein VMW24_17330 [Sedimentisphaerales bacterium]|nr:hypothetical protein [Sedimentisphaerales bacterium]